MPSTKSKDSENCSLASPRYRGGLTAIQTNGETPVLQLADLHGDIIATAALSETETKPLTNSTMTEYGVPTTATPAKYNWLGAEELPTELSSGVIAMGARSYIPQLGRFLQTDPIPGGSANAYAYVFGDPIDNSDPAGTSSLPLWLISFASQNAQQVAEAAATREAAAQAEALRRATEASEAANRAAEAQLPSAEEPLGGSEDWTCGDAEETGQEAEGCGGGGDGSGECSGDMACAASSEWVCTLAGAVVAAGVGAATAGVTGILADGAFTAGCELGSSSNRSLVAGLSSQKPCFNEFTYSKRTHKDDHRVEKCYA